MARRNSHGISWQTIRLEGSLLLPDLLEQIAKNEATHQKESDYQIPAGLRMIEEIGRSYQIARALHAEFKNRRQSSNTDAFQLTDTFFMKFMSSCLGWTEYQRVRSKRVGDYGYPVQKIAFERIPITVAAYDMGLDTSDSRFGISGAKVRNRSLFQMSQEYLNALGKSSWGVVSNGSVIRLLRSSPTMARPQYLEFDLYSMLEDDHYSEYTLLWKILHVSRVFDVENQIDMTVWEEWRNETISTGERVRDGLRGGVTKALTLLGSGFIANPANEVLRQNLNDGKLTAEDLYHQLLRLVYRFLFLFALEERRAENGLRLVFIPDASFAKERDLYEKGYSLDRLREVMLHRSSYNYYTDLWAAQKIVFTSLAKGEKRLALPALGGLFSSGMCDDLDSATLDNATFLNAMISLRWANNTSGQFSYIDYKNMGTEELGSVYESLLELVPTVDMPARIFRFIGVEDDESTAGNARKTSGSYYTPSFLVDQLVKTALVPVLEKTAKEHVQDKAEALLSLSVIDPACGSGHFILAAARKIAEYVAVARDDDGVVTPSEYRRALRDVISRCIYGVDLNPMAVELTKMALWLEGYEPGKPLSFLDRHLLCGNSLLGVFDLTVLDKGIPKDAFKQLTGDDKEYCANLAKQNAIGLKTYKTKIEEKSLHEFDLFSETFLDDTYSSLDSMPEDDVNEVEKKIQQYKKLKELMDQDLRMVASDIYIGAFLMQKRPGKVVPTSQTLYRYKILQQPSETDLEAIKHAREACKKANALHWPFAFPKVFSEGGFDVVLGNPPWERNKVLDKEFFAQRMPQLLEIKKANERKDRIEELKNGDNHQRALYAEYQNTVRTSDAFSVFVHLEDVYGRFPLSGIGDVNLYPLFTELSLKLRSPEGRVGIIVQTNIATADSTKGLFAWIVNSKLLHSLYDFENKKRIFPAVHCQQRFCLLTIGSATASDFASFLEEYGHLSDGERHYELTIEDLKQINPNTETLPLFRSKYDALLAKRIYKEFPVAINESDKGIESGWHISLSTMFHMTNDSNLFQDAKLQELFPLYEGKMTNHYDHRWATYENQSPREVAINEKINPDYKVNPQFFVSKREVIMKTSKLQKNILNAWYNGEEHLLRNYLLDTNDVVLSSFSNSANILKEFSSFLEDRLPKWLFGFRNTTNSTNERTVIAPILPLCAVGNKITLVELDGIKDDYYLLAANLNSIVLDYFARQKVGATDLNNFYFKQFPIIPKKQYSSKQIEYIKNRVVALTVNTYEMQQALGEQIHQWDSNERDVMKAELDALYGRLYRLNRQEVMFILDPVSVMGSEYPSKTFPGLKKNENKDYGEYRTMRLVLEAWDRQERQPELWQ